MFMVQSVHYRVLSFRVFKKYQTSFCVKQTENNDYLLIIFEKKNFFNIKAYGKK